VTLAKTAKLTPGEREPTGGRAAWATLAVLQRLAKALGVPIAGLLE
jgi:hypothetical protein